MAFKRNTDDQAVSALVDKTFKVYAGMPWDVRLALDGRVYSANAGNQTAPITPNLAIDTDQPEFALPIPNGTTVIPLSIQVKFEVTGAAGAGCTAYFSGNDIGSTTSSAISGGPVNHKPITAQTSVCTPVQVVTSNTAALTNVIEFFRGGFAGDADASGSETTSRWSYLDGGAPVLSGGSTLFVAVETPTSGTCFIVVTWAEFLTSELE